MTRRRRKKALTHAPYARLVSATFLLNRRTGRAVAKADMLAAGVSVNRIAKIEAASPQADL